MTDTDKTQQVSMNRLNNKIAIPRSSPMQPNNSRSELGNKFELLVSHKQEEWWVPKDVDYFIWKKSWRIILGMK